MPVLLTTSRLLPPADTYKSWCAIVGDSSELLGLQKIDGLAEKLEQAFDAIKEEWWDHAHRLNVTDSSASLSHAASCNSSVSDFGAMLAWTHLYFDWNQSSDVVLVVCDDPWMFRHFASLGGQCLVAAPRFRWAEWRLALRGFAARARYALAVIGAHVRFRQDIRNCPQNMPAIVSYGHPASTADGKDAYFGDLMTWSPGLIRMLHTDCSVKRSAKLCAGQSTFSLHAWGSIWFALTLPFRMWRASARPKNEPFWWLIHRATVLEGGTGQAASIAWQVHCQGRWMAAQRPTLALWPWENHGWEQALVRSAHVFGIRTAGYQHTVVGRRHWVHAVDSNRDGSDSLPDRIICNGPIWTEALAEYGIPRTRMEVGGTLRFSDSKPLVRDPQGPIFVALPFAHVIAHQMVRAIESIASKGGFRFIVRDHPMNPYSLPKSPGVKRAEQSLSDSGGVAAVLYAATTVGLEALIGGLPVVRFIPEGNASVDVMPETLDIPAAATHNLTERLDDAVTSEIDSPPLEEFFCPPDKIYWRQLTSNERTNS